jgi:glycosyltransferase involved in cell wall biosynthesis
MKILRVVLTGEEPPHYTITNAFQKTFDIVDTIYWDEIKSISEMNGIVRARVQAIKYDAVFMQIQHPNIIELETAKVMSQHSLVLNWTGDVRTDITWYEEIAPYVITLFTNMTDVEKLRQKGFKSDYLQCGYDHKYYFQKQQKRYNTIGFCANYYQQADFPLKQHRVDAVIELKKNFPEQFHLYGNGWENIGIKSEGNAINKWEANLYNESLLALSVSHFDYSRYFSDRLLREMACGCCVLSHRFKDCNLEFTEGKHILYWDNLKELVELCQYYFQHPDKAMEIGEAAAQYVRENYTWDIFTEKLLNIIKNNYGTISSEI